MEITLTGTGSPVPVPGRAATSIVVEIGDESVLIDCGPRTVYQLMAAGIDPGDIETLFFTHQHLDHNASFFHFAFTSWTEGGRESLDIYGPDGTDRLVDALYSIYEEDIEYRRAIHPTDGISTIQSYTVTEGFDMERDGWRVSALPVEHSIETYAYRFDEHDTDASFVFSGDTRKIDALCEFATGADVLVQDANNAPIDEDRIPDPDEQFVWPQYRDGGGGDYGSRDIDESTISAVHCSPAEAGEIAQAAGVRTLVLTHLMPYRDLDAMRQAAESTFDGEVIVAEDGMALSV